MQTTATPRAALDALADRVHSALESSPHLTTRSMRVEAEHGHVRLAGDVNSFFEKQIAQEVVRRVDGVDRVENQLQVNWM